jgi:hypothetical protein
MDRSIRGSMKKILEINTKYDTARNSAPKSKSNALSMYTQKLAHMFPPIGAEITENKNQVFNSEKVHL